MPSSDPLQPVLGPLDGALIFGGCDNCDAYQEPVQVARKVWVLKVYHDDWCPTLRRMEGRTA